MSERGGYGFSDEVKQEALRRCQKRCEYCGKEEVSEGPLREKSNFRLEGHHIVPVHYAKQFLANTEEVRAFISGPDNIEFICPECHQTEHKLNEDNNFFQTIIENTLGPEAFKKRSDKPKKKRKHKQPSKQELLQEEQEKYARELQPYDCRVKWSERTELEAQEIARIEQQIRELNPGRDVPVVRKSHRRGETTVVESKGNLWVRMWEIARGMGAGRGEDWASLAADRDHQKLTPEDQPNP